MVKPAQPCTVTVDPLTVAAGGVGGQVVITCLPPPASLAVHVVLEILVGADSWLRQGRDVIVHLIDEPLVRVAVSAPYVPGVWRVRVRLGGVDSRGREFEDLLTGEPVTLGLAEGGG